MVRPMVGEWPARATMEQRMASITIRYRSRSDGRQTLEFAQAHRFDGVQFLEPRRLTLGLILACCRHFDAKPRRWGCTWRSGYRHPIRFDVPETGLPGIDSSELAGRWCSCRGPGRPRCHHARVVRGRPPRPISNESLGAPGRGDRRGTPTAHAPAQGLGIRVAIETHADLTVDELMSAMVLIDPEVAGVTLDTGNLVMRLDDPVEATRRLAPWVVATHIKDAVLAFSPRGFSWQARPVGSGILPLPDILAIFFAANPSIALSIELHPRTYDLPIFDRKWLGYFPKLRPESLAAVVRLAAQRRKAATPMDRSQGPRSSRPFPGPTVTSTGWPAHSEYLRSVVRTIAGKSRNR